VNLPIFRISIYNATLLSGAYLLIATVLEVIRRLFTVRWAETACLEMEKFPARTLDLVGLLDPLRRFYAWGKITDWQVRVIFGATTITLIFLLAMMVGGGMWLFARYVGHREEEEGL
jgi:hypothetical protein